MAPGFLYPESTVTVFMVAGLLKCLKKYPAFKYVVQNQDIYIYKIQPGRTKFSDPEMIDINDFNKMNRSVFSSRTAE